MIRVADGTRRRALFVSYDGILGPLGRAQVLPYVLGLAGRGYAMGVLSFEKAEDLADRGGVAELSARLAEAEVPWTHLRYHASPRLAATGWDVVQGVRAIRRLDPDLVHARSYVAGEMALRALADRPGGVLADLRGFWVDERIEGHGWRPSSLAVRIARRAERALLTRSGHLVFLTRSAAECAPELAGGEPLAPHVVIPTCVDLARFAPPADPAVARAERGLPPQPVLVHSGTLGGRYQANRTMQVARAFVARSGGTFLVVSRERDAVRSLASSHGVEVRLETARHEEVPGWLAAADAGLALINVGFSARASAPTKVGEYLACGLSVAASSAGDLAEQFADATCSFVVSDGDPPEALADRLLAAAASPTRSRESRGIAERYFDLGRAVDRYAAAYRAMGLEPCG